MLLRVAVVAGHREARGAVEEQWLLSREARSAVATHAGTGGARSGAGARAAQDACGVLRRVQDVRWVRAEERARSSRGAGWGNHRRCDGVGQVRCVHHLRRLLRSGRSRCSCRGNGPSIGEWNTTSLGQAGCASSAARCRLGRRDRSSGGLIEEFLVVGSDHMGGGGRLGTSETRRKLLRRLGRIRCWVSGGSSGSRRERDGSCSN